MKEFIKNNSKKCEYEYFGNYDIYACSNCGRELRIAGDYKADEVEENFCPRCGFEILKGGAK
jgi:DNA-directed RNA polymerase subunit RPC12/RpoP